MFQPEEDIDKLDYQLLYINFDDFQQWLNKYSFVRDMVREALMPKIWSLKDHQTTPEIDISSGYNNSKKSSTSLK